MADDDGAAQPSGADPDADPEADPDTGSAAGSGAEPEAVATDERVLGVLAEPGLAGKVARKIAGELPPLLTEASRKEGSWGGTWRVEVDRQLLPLDARGSLRLLEGGRSLQDERGWDAVVVLTELPRRVGGTRPILADGAPEYGVGLISLAAMGALRIRRRTRDMIVHLVSAYLCRRPDQALAGRSRGSLRHVARASGFEVIEEPEADSQEAEPEQVVDANVRLGGAGFHLALPGRLGQWRLLGGMVRANRPWRLVPSLSPALAGAVAGAAFGIFYSNVWLLADALSPPRLVLIHALAIIAMIAWLVLDNGLWDRSADPRLRSLSVLYNVATVATISCGVAVMSALLYAGMLLAACVVIPFTFLTSQLGHPAGLSDLATIAWLATCLGTFAGALGSGLAGQEAVRQAAFSLRERERQDRRSAQEERSERSAVATGDSGRSGPSAPL